jgi:hypothetical protein
MADASSIRARYTAVGRDLNERARRLFGAAEARTGGYGGITASSRATGLARGTIGRELKHLDDPGWLVGKVRRQGAADQLRHREIPRCLKSYTSCNSELELPDRSIGHRQMDRDRGLEPL